MTRYLGVSVLLGFLAVALSWSPPAQADEAESPLAWQAVPLAELDAQRAMGADDQVEADAGTIVTGNSASTDGAIMTNSISGDAFQGATGLFNVIQNNGNNNAIQAGIAVNLSVSP